ncbi:MAG: hypothetical protein V7765_20865 [Oleispira sp.]
MTLTSLNRYQAFASHLLLSLIIFSGILICITQYWYPGILFDTANGWKAIGLIISIDLILGPILTLIVFNPNKSSLKFDLSIIAVIQVAALIYGSWTIHVSRPIALAFINNSFYSLHANADNAADIQARVNELESDQLYYVFNDLSQNRNINADQFQPYQKYAPEAAKHKSPYIHQSTDNKYLFVELDPAISSSRYIKIDRLNGSILSFSTAIND